jgi:hypothetical protein
VTDEIEEIGRNPATLKVSLYCAHDDVKEPGQARVDFIGRCAEIGLSRLIAFPARWSPTTETQALFAEDCRAAGIKLASAPDPAVDTTA